MENTISDRIFALIGALGYNKRSFSNELGLSNDVTIGRIVNEQREPSFKILSMIIQTFGNVNANWLLTGEGEMLLDNKKSITESITEGKKNAYPNAQVNAQVNDYPNTQNEEIQNLVAEAATVYSKDLKITDDTPTIYNSKISANAVPFYDLPISAGALGLIATGDEKQVVGYVDMPVFNSCERVLPVMGVSMEPLIYSGDLIGIKSVTNLSTRWDFLQTGKIYLIITKEERMIKYINEASDQQYIVCSSPNFAPFKVHKADVLQLFRVAAIARGL